MTKSDSIRAILKQKPRATVKEIAALLKRQRVKASVALICSIKYRTPKQSVSLAQINAAKAFSARVRGIDNARAALAAFGRLADAK